MLPGRTVGLAVLKRLIWLNEGAGDGPLFTWEAREIMDDDDQFLSQVLAGISEAEIVTIFFPLLRRALVIDTRHNEDVGHMVRVMPQESSMDDRIKSIEKLRPQFGKVRSILGIPWIKSVNTLREQGIGEQLVKRLSDAGMPRSQAEEALNAGISELWRVEHRAFVAMIQGEGYQTIWTARG